MLNAAPLTETWRHQRALRAWILVAVLSLIVGVAIILTAPQSVWPAVIIGWTWATPSIWYHSGWLRRDSAQYPATTGRSR